MIVLKPGVKLIGLKPELLVALMAAQSAYAMYDADCIVTSCTDGDHTTKSLHYAGNAIDLRTRHISQEQAERVADVLKSALGSEFDVVLEKTHLHIEYDPKRV